VQTATFGAFWLVYSRPRMHFSLTFVRAYTVFFTYRQLAYHYLAGVLSPVKQKLLDMTMAAITLIILMAASIQLLENMGDIPGWGDTPGQGWEMYDAMYFVIVSCLQGGCAVHLSSLVPLISHWMDTR